MNRAQAVDNGGGSMYQAHQKVYPREVKGRFASLRVFAVAVLLGLFYGLAWLRWDGHQAILFDLPARKFYIFGLTLWPQDFIYLTALLIIAALSLFFVTALAGRVFCGYACPQTVWTEVFVWIERLTEGKRQKRIKLDKGPMTFEKLWRKSAKQFLWITLAAFTGFTFVGYFTPIAELARKLVSFQLGGWEMFWIGLYGFATYGNAGFMREQVCRYMCPYARFQSAMFDRDTLIISYDENRGEPRGGRKRGVDPKTKGLGDCIDCTMCVQVCPTGIDIREGLQYECIACAACIDACDSVMDKMGYDRGLVRYSTQHAIEGNSTHVLRPRVFIYGTLLAVISGVLLFSVVTRTPLMMDVIRDRNALFRELNDGRIENVYTLKIMNMDNAPHRYELTVDGLPGIAIDTGRTLIQVDSGEVAAVPTRISVARDAASGGGHDIALRLQDTDNAGHAVETKARFLMPSQ